MKYRFMECIFSTFAVPFYEIKTYRSIAMKPNRISNSYQQAPTEQETAMFLYLLRYSLWGTSCSTCINVPNLEEVRMEQIWQLADKQTVLGLVADVLQRLYGTELSVNQKARIIKVAAQYSSEHQRLNDMLKETFTFLQQKGFLPILLKGQGNAQRYPAPLLRQCGDIDIYIGPEDYTKACASIGELVGQEEMKNATQSDKHLHVSFQHVFLELHRIAERMPNPCLNPRYQRLSARWLKRGQTDTVSINGFPVAVPARQFNVLYVFYHIWHHFVLGGIGLRQLCDWCILLHEAAGKIDQEQLLGDLKQLHLLKPWQIMGYIAVEKLGLLPDEMPFYCQRYQKQAYRAWLLILCGGNFGKFKSNRNISRESYWERKFKSFLELHINAFRFFRISPADALLTYAYRIFVGIKGVLADAFPTATQFPPPASCIPSPPHGELPR